MIRFLYPVLLLLGGIAIAVAVVADQLGISGPGFGFKQYFLASTGLLAMLTGAIVRLSRSRRAKVNPWWRDLSILLLGMGVLYGSAFVLYPRDVGEQIIRLSRQVATLYALSEVKTEPSEPLLEELVQFFEARAREKWFQNQAKFDLERPTTGQEAQHLIETIRLAYRDFYLSGVDVRKHQLDDVEEQPMGEFNGARRYRVRFRNDLGLTVEGILSVPVAQGPHPLIIIPNGMSGTPERLFLIDREDYHHGVACQFEGDSVVFALHIPSNPDFSYEVEMQNRMNWAAQVAGMNYWYYLMIDKVISALDYLDTRSEIDPDRTAIYGISMGGATAILAAVGDERIEVIAASGTNVFTPHYQMMFQERRYVYPHYYWYNRLSAPDLGTTALAVFPRRLIIELNRRDRAGNFETALHRAQQIKRIYRLLGHEEDVVIVTFDQESPVAPHGHEMGISGVKQQIDAWFGINPSTARQYLSNITVARTE